MRRIYIAGKMRGLPLLNFPAFDAATARFREQGWDVISPAEMDRALGFDEKKDTATPEFLRQAILRDVQAITRCDALAVIPGWETSRGVHVEISLARFLQIPVYCAETMEEIRGSIILQGEPT